MDGFTAGVVVGLGASLALDLGALVALKRVEGGQGVAQAFGDALRGAKDRWQGKAPARAAAAVDEPEVEEFEEDFDEDDDSVYDDDERI